MTVDVIDRTAARRRLRRAWCDEIIEAASANLHVASHRAIELERRDDDPFAPPDVPRIAAQAAIDHAVVEVQEAAERLGKVLGR